MAWPRFRNPIQKLIVPTADLGLQELDFSALEFPGDVPLVLAVQVVQTPAGARVVQADASGGTGRPQVMPWAKIRDATEGAGNTGIRPTGGYQGIVWAIEVVALTGAPTNVMYKFACSFDGGTTWYEGVSGTATTTGLVVVAGGQGQNNPSTGNDFKGSVAVSMPLPPLVRLDWSFTAGAAPTVQHRIWENLL